MTRLSDTTLRGAKAKDKAYKLSDGDGLYLEVLTNGKRYWRYRVERAGVDHRFSLGEYPLVSIAEARTKRDEMKKKVKEDRLGEEEPKDITFGEAAELWVRSWELKTKSGERAKYIPRGRLKNHLLPWFENKPLGSITSAELLDRLEAIQAVGTKETAKRIYIMLRAIYDYAIARDLTEKDPTRKLKGAIGSIPDTGDHRAAIVDPIGIGGLMRKIDAYSGTETVKAALLLSAMTFVRPFELRSAEWCDIDLVHAEWRIPAEKMKMKRDHLVPLSTQAVQILRDLQVINGKTGYVFPGGDKDGMMSESTVTRALRYMGIPKEVMCAHGFRAMASTVLNEHEWNRDAIEMQLAHAKGDKIRTAYNHAQWIGIRRDMMQWYSDYLFELRGNEINPEFK